MNLLQRTWNVLTGQQRALPGPPVTWDYFMRDDLGSATGISVSESTALNLSPVWSGVFQLAGDVAKLPLNHNRILPNGGKEVIGGKLHRALHDQANPEMTAFKFRECMQALAILYGNAYAEIIRDALGAPVGMYPINPTRVTAVRENGRLRYRVHQPSGGQVFVAAENMIHGSGLSLDGVIGENMTSHGSESIGLGLAAEKFGAAFFGNGATFGGVIELPMTLAGPQGENVKANIRSAIEAVHAGVERAHKILVVAGGAKFTQRGTAPNEAQFKETRQFQIQEVSRWLVMPPHKLGDLENAHFTNIEESEIQYWKGTVHRWLKMWEQEYRSKLIPSLERNLQSIDFNMEGELRGTSTQRAAFYKEMVGLGAYTINTVLEKEGLPTIGPAGDMHLVPLNMIPVEKYAEYVDAQIDKMNAPAPQPQLPAAPKESEPGESAGERFVKAIEEVRAETKLLADWVTAEAQTHAVAATEARAAKASAEALAVEKVAEAVRLEQEAQAAKDEAAAARVAVQEANEKLAAAQAETTGAKAEADAKDARITDALADVAAKAAALSQAEAVALEQTTIAHEAQAKATEAETAAESRAADVVRLQSELAAAEAARVEQERRAEQATAAHAAQQAAENERLARVVTAHQALVSDAVRRFARVETERARRRAGSPEQLQKWADAFYDESVRDNCADGLVPAVRACLAWRGSAEDPYAVARALADAYQAESVGQIRTLTAGMVGDEFQAAATRMLARWEQERPQAVADRVVRDEITALVNR